MRIRITLVATILALSACGGSTESSSEAVSSQETVPAEKEEVPTESSVEYVSKYLWTVGGGTCNDINSILKATYDKNRGRILYRDGKIIQDDNGPGKKYSFEENPDRSFSYLMTAYVNEKSVNWISVEVHQKIRFTEVGDLYIETKTYYLKFNDFYDSIDQLDYVNPNEHPQFYEIKTEAVTEQRCEERSTVASEPSASKLDTSLKGSEEFSDTNSDIEVVAKTNTVVPQGVSSEDADKIRRYGTCAFLNKLFIGTVIGPREYNSVWENIIDLRVHHAAMYSTLTAIIINKYPEELHDRGMSIANEFLKSKEYMNFASTEAINKALAEYCPMANLMTEEAKSVRSDYPNLFQTNYDEARNIKRP